MIQEKMSLEGKAALIAGDGPWSQALAEAMLGAGAGVALGTRRVRTPQVQSLMRSARAQGRRAVAIAADTTKPRQVEHMVERAISSLGKVDILINCNDAQLAKPFPEITDREWREVMDLNLYSAFLCTQAVAGHMLQRKWGRVINLASGLALRGIPNGTAFCASKGAVLQFTRALGLEWARSGVRVNAIGLGWFPGTLGAKDDPQDPLARYIPSRRLGRPADVAGLAVFLASDAAEFVAGQMFLVDGGVYTHA